MLNGDYVNSKRCIKWKKKEGIWYNWYWNKKHNS